MSYFAAPIVPMYFNAWLIDKGCTPNNEWNYLSILKPQLFHRSSLEMDKFFIHFL